MLSEIWFAHFEDAIEFMSDDDCIYEVIEQNIDYSFTVKFFL